MYIFDRDVSFSALSDTWFRLTRLEQVIIILIACMVVSLPFLFLLSNGPKRTAPKRSEPGVIPTIQPKKIDPVGKSLKFVTDDAFFSASSSGSFSGNQMTTEAIVCIPKDIPGNYNLISLIGKNKDIFTSSYTMKEENIDAVFSMLLSDDSYLSATTPLAPNSCHHIAVTAKATGGICTLNVFTDGDLALTTSKTDTCTLSQLPYEQFVIGSNVHGFKSFNGVIDEVRISDVVRYTDAFTPATTPFTPDDNTQHLFHFEGDTTDASSNPASPPGETGGTEFTGETAADLFPSPTGQPGTSSAESTPSQNPLEAPPAGGITDPQITVIPGGTTSMSPTPTPLGTPPSSPTPTLAGPGSSSSGGTPSPTPLQSTGPTPLPADWYALPGPPPEDLNQAVKFTYRNQAAVFYDDERMGITGSFTVEAWIRPLADPPGIYIPAVILSKASPQTLYRTPFSLQLGLYLNNIAPYFSVDANNARYTIRATNRFLTFKQWHHVAASVDATNGSIKVFVDGYKSGELNVGKPLVFNDPKIAVTLGSLCLDENNAGYCSRHSLYFNGEVEEARISKVVRYTADFTPATAPFTADYDTLALFRFDGNLQDSSGRNNHGTVYGTVDYVQSTVGGEGTPAQEPTPADENETYIE